jgi:hypothetical protein
MVIRGTFASLAALVLALVVATAAGAERTQPLFSTAGGVQSSGPTVRPWRG